ncbi:MAG: pseudouridine synthase [Bacteroides sp.]|nr:pseudouridine synthase [Prevotella sp.]MCM1407656.1 pseudouridine synthase [Treponema brennaborense]MCM1469194.1 pseudouridine synthase [Bacteroides sp.]
MKQILPYTTIYADDSIVVLNKKSGLLVAADRYNADAPRLDIEAEKEFGHLFAVHRIDKDTSGLVLYARTEEAHRSVSMAFEKRTVKKIYHALIHGRPSWNTLRIDVPLVIDGDIRHRTVANRRQGKPSVTDFRLLCSCGSYSWIEARPETGRTHQIRAHLREAGHTIVCDPLYSGNQKPIRLSEIKRSWKGDPFEERPLLERLALHAYQLKLAHPASGEEMLFTAPYQHDMEAVRKQFEKIFRINPFAPISAL